MLRFTFAILFTLFALECMADGGSRIELKNSDGGFQLLKNGQPFQIKGVGGDSYLAELAASGGNAVRTWGADDDAALQAVRAAHAPAIVESRADGSLYMDRQGIVFFTAGESEHEHVTVQPAEVDGEVAR